MARAAGPERRLLAIYTGGTIGMRSERGVLVPGKGLAAVLRTLPMFHDEGHAQACGLPEDTLVLPPASPACPDQRVMYTVLECQPLFDSSDMTITEWVQIAQTIERHYGQYHGFVVIHGTDTMAFAASVLSFMLENLQKTVILTGAQVPIHALWNDGRENLLGALLLAGQYVIPEVCLFFQNQLFRGNRVTKVDTRRFAAFCSPNLPPLATVGADVTINRELVRKVRGQGRLVVHGSMERDVGLLRLYPGIPAALVRVFLQPPLKGVVMETFGSGNGPTKPDLLQELREAAERGLVIVNCTHCLQGTVTSDYGAGTALAGAGTISGSDMTSEAALAKLSYVLGLPGLSLDGRKELLARDLRGEMTLPATDELRPSLRGSTPGLGVAQLLSLSQGWAAARRVRPVVTVDASGLNDSRSQSPPWCLARGCLRGPLMGPPAVWSLGELLGDPSTGSKCPFLLGRARHPFPPSPRQVPYELPLPPGPQERQARTWVSAGGWQALVTQLMGQNQVVACVLPGLCSQGWGSRVGLGCGA
ncbi:60 kDa lysophospholipase isoform X4 [Globicephala melas]|uniref:60 kDa lysophospholipase isoform X4 n=1 Tax=Globicephala melas TaxID=9731 RepID=UPI00293D9610|nr:60 kDa lysophospholipase isoform X4 [Globicephala melas]